MNEEVIRDAILNLLEGKNLYTEEVLEKIAKLTDKKDKIFVQLLLLEKNKLIKREILDNDDPLLKSRWTASEKWKEKLEEEKKITQENDTEDRLKENLIVATIPPEFWDESKDENVIETRDALAAIFFSARDCIRISTPYLDEMLRLFTSLLALKAPANINIKLMTISQDNEYSELRLQRSIEDLRNRFKNTQIVKFEKKRDTQEGFIFKTHAKVIIVDDKYLLITSANMMKASYLDNFEMGYLTKNKEMIKSSIKIFDMLFGKMENI